MKTLAPAIVFQFSWANLMIAPGSEERVHNGLITKAGKFDLAFRKSVLGVL